MTMRFVHGISVGLETSANPEELCIRYAEIMRDEHNTLWIKADDYEMKPLCDGYAFVFKGAVVRACYNHKELDEKSNPTTPGVEFHGIVENFDGQDQLISVRVTERDEHDKMVYCFPFKDGRKLEDGRKRIVGNNP